MLDLRRYDFTVARPLSTVRQTDSAGRGIPKVAFYPSDARETATC